MRARLTDCVGLRLAANLHKVSGIDPPTLDEADVTPLKGEPSAGVREGDTPRMKEPSAGVREGDTPRMKEPSAGVREGQPLP